ncbi:MAG TPA: hypothetical protein VGE40_07415 [Bacilli bacterium]
MIEGFLLIVGCYGVCVALVHLFHQRSQQQNRSQQHNPRPSKPKPHVPHYVLITHNNQMQVEWYLRSLLIYSKMRGQSLKITIIDEGSQDDTLAIVWRMSLNRYVNINTVQSSCTVQLPDSQVLQDGANHHQHDAALDANEQMIFIRLNDQEDLLKLPLPH